MEINSTTLRHSAWVAAMGWHNKQPLEYLGLIASEIGEAVAEAPANVITEQFGSELMDIVLRTIDLAHMQQVDLPSELRCLLTPALPASSFEGITFSEVARLAVCSSPGHMPTTTVLETLALMTPDLAKAMNDCRGATVAASFGKHLASLVLRVLCLAQQQGVNIDLAILTKIEKNAVTGNKGRLI